MKENNYNQIEQSLLMYKETVSPSQEDLQVILSHIPEQKTNEEKARAIRSPYRWVAVAEFVTLCSIMLALYPTISLEMSNNRIDQEFNTIDEQNDAFQIYMDSTDYDEPTL